jgi:hypothetical protein
VALVLGLVAAAVLLAPWKDQIFAVDARALYDGLYDQAIEESDADTLGWLAIAGYTYQAPPDECRDRGGSRRSNPTSAAETGPARAVAVESLTA